MATEESNIVQKCRLTTGQLGTRLFRNNRGFFYTIDIVKHIRDAAKRMGLQGVLDLLNSGRLRSVRAGLEVPGSSDLIGWHTVTITPTMVGKKIAVFTAIEVKKPDNKKGATAEQKVFIDNVKNSGGIAAVVYSDKEAVQVIRDFNMTCVE